VQLPLAPGCRPEWLLAGLLPPQTRKEREQGALDWFLLGLLRTGVGNALGWVCQDVPLLCFAGGYGRLWPGCCAFL
ncbi:MAG TPA: hypothetical protein VGN34_23615, partial [Ktedonobacteraceae bacterium]